MTIIIEARLFRAAQVCAAGLGHITPALTFVHIGADGTIAGTNGEVMFRSSHSVDLQQDLLIRTRLISKNAEHCEIRDNLTIQMYSRNGNLLQDQDYSTTTASYPNVEHALRFLPEWRDERAPWRYAEGFSPRYLARIREVFPVSDKVSLELPRSSMGPAAVYPEDGYYPKGTVMAIMPMQLER